jgi:hypothetical protein
MARWLQEAGRRVHWAPLPEPLLESPPAAQVKKSAIRVRHLALFGVLTGSYLQYYMLDVMLQINSLPAIVVFVPLASALAV